MVANHKLYHKLYLDLYPEIQRRFIKQISQNFKQFKKSKQNIFLHPNANKKRKNIKQGNLVDQLWMQEYIDYFDNFIFTTLDCKAKNIINMPLGFMFHDSISQNANYMFEQNNNNKYFSKIFWRGRISTHNIRSKIIDYFIDQKSKQVDIKHWNIDHKKYAIYKKSNDPNRPNPPKIEYENYFNGLKNSDFFLVIRGDKPWTLSFMDCLRAGTIPICIDTFYQDMGWENINMQPEDLFLHFNTDTYLVEEIYEKCLKVLQDKERVLYMKNNINQFYKKYILTDRTVKNNYHTECWSDFIAAKILEIQRNDYKLISNQFISPLVKEIKQKIYFI